MIKTASPDDEIATRDLERERLCYRLPGNDGGGAVASSSCFRKLYDVIDDCTIALEWLETTLADVRYQPGMRTYALIRTVLKETLASCEVLESEELVNTGASIWSWRV